MAKIAFFCENLHSESRIGHHAFELATLLAEHRNEVQVFTNRSQDLQLPSFQRTSHLEILSFLVNWNALEMTKVLRALYEFRPDIIYLVQPHASCHKRIFSLFQFLVYPLPFLPSTKIVLSLFDLAAPYQELKFYRHLLEKSNFITVFNEKQKRLVYDILKKGSLKIVDTLPLPYPLAQNLSDDVRLPPSFPHKFVAIPGSLSEHHDLEILFETLYQFLNKFPSMGVLILGGREQLKVRKLRSLLSKLTKSGFWENILFTGSLNISQEFLYIKRSLFVWISTLPEEGLLFEDSVSAAILSRRPIVMTPLQKEGSFTWLRDSVRIIAEPLTIEGQVRGLGQASLTPTAETPTPPPLDILNILNRLNHNRDHFGNELSRIFSRRY